MVTIVMPVSRDFYLTRIFAQLELLECDAKQVNLLTYVDGDLELFPKARNLTELSKFNERLCVYRKKGPANVGSIRRRRQRIADIHNEMKEIIGSCDYIFLLEDDTLVPTNTLQKLLKSYADVPYAGFVSGIEIGRWGFDHIGAWSIDNVYEPTKITSIENLEVSPHIPPPAVFEVDAAGLYCCLIKRDLYMNHTFKPFEDTLGPDVDFGIELRKAGYKNYVDYSIRCKHLTKKGEISFLNKNVIQVEFTKQNDSWLIKQL